MCVCILFYPEALYSLLKAKQNSENKALSMSGPFQSSKYKSSESCAYQLEEQDKIRNEAMTFHKRDHPCMKREPPSGEVHMDDIQ